MLHKRLVVLRVGTIARVNRRMLTRLRRLWVVVAVVVPRAAATIATKAEPARRMQRRAYPLQQLHSRRSIPPATVPRPVSVKLPENTQGVALLPPLLLEITLLSRLSSPRCCRAVPRGMPSPHKEALHAPVLDPHTRSEHSVACSPRGAAIKSLKRSSRAKPSSRAISARAIQAAPPRALRRSRDLKSPLKQGLLCRLQGRGQLEGRWVVRRRW